jgi:type IV pilus assembly protein PilY1
MLIMGGGYNTCEDSDPHTCTGTFKGNRIYVIDVDTGVLLKSFTTDRGVVGDIALVRDANGMAQYGYAADLGGNLYRISMGSDAPSAWTMTKIASLGCATPTDACTANRKFLFGPDVVREGDVFYLMLGSGDREKPLSSYTNAAGVSNYFFVVKDKPTDANWLTSQSSTCASTNVMCLASLLPISGNTTPSTADLDAKRGWYLSLSSQEQVVTSAITVLGTVTFSTHSPISAQQNVCSANLGTARVYNLAYLDAASKNGTTSRFETLPKGGLSPSPVAGQVTLDNGETVIFVIGASKNSPLEATKPPPLTSTPAQPTKRVYWNIKK